MHLYKSGLSCDSCTSICPVSRQSYLFKILYFNWEPRPVLADQWESCSPPYLPTAIQPLWKDWHYARPPLPSIATINIIIAAFSERESSLYIAQELVEMFSTVTVIKHATRANKINLKNKLNPWLRYVFLLQSILALSRFTKWIWMSNCTYFPWMIIVQAAQIPL